MDTDIASGREEQDAFLSIAGKGAPRRSLVDIDVNSAVSAAIALGHKLRMQILYKLAPFRERGLSAGSLSMELEIVPSSLSYHLQQMTRAGVLIARPDGRSMFYSVNHDVVAALCDCLLRVTRHITHRDGLCVPASGGEYEAGAINVDEERDVVAAVRFATQSHGGDH
jgi:ArsR family transcriptional regulator, arsenate/arsenite/antimonite-responsive transcriptional repressor